MKLEPGITVCGSQGRWGHFFTEKGGHFSKNRKEDTFQKRGIFSNEWRREGIPPGCHSPNYASVGIPYFRRKRQFIVTSTILSAKVIIR